MHTARFSLNPISLLIPHALHLVCFPYTILKKQMAVLHIHPSCTRSKQTLNIFDLLFTLLQQFSTLLSHLPTLSSMFTFCHLSPPILIVQTKPFSELPPKKPPSHPHVSIIDLSSSVKLLLLSFPHFILKPQSYTQNSEPVFCAVFADLFVNADIPDHTHFLKISFSFSCLTHPS